MLAIWKHSLTQEIVSFFIFSLIGGNSPNNIHGRLSEQFQGDTRLLEQLLLSQAAIRNLENVFWRGLQEGFSQLVSDFKEISRKFILDVLEKDSKKLWKPCALIWFLGPLKNIHLVTLSHWSKIKWSAKLCYIVPFNQLTVASHTGLF